jgi:photosystem II stability/assembly factor-like uncharacterized protein
VLVRLVAALSALTLSVAPVHPAVPGGQTLRQVWFAGASTAWAWTQDLNGKPQGLELTTTAGRTWTDVTPPGLSQQTGDHVITGFYGLTPADAWVIYGGVSDSSAQHLAATTDGGRHWTTVATTPSVTINQYTYHCGVDFVTAQDGWCQAEPPFVGSESVYLWHTTDGGRRWQLISRTTPEGGTAGALPYGGDKNIQFLSPTTGWAIFASPRTAPLYETTDGGRTWVKKKVAIAPGNPDSGTGFTGQPLVSGSRGAVGYTISGQPLKTVVYTSTDAGAAWKPVTPPGTPQGWVADTLTPESWRLVNGDHILATTNAGHTWHTITTNVTFHLYYAFDDPTPPVVNFVTSQVGWIAGSALWRTTNGGKTWKNLAVPGT